MGKCALDLITADTAHELRSSGIAVVSLWPGLMRTEHSESAAAHLPGCNFAGAESQRFTGRAVAALAGDPGRLAWSGRAVASRLLVDHYG